MGTKKTSWPILEFEDLKDTLELLHQWTQIVGKVRLKKSKWQNHSWHVTLYVDSHGLTTGMVPYENGSFEIRIDFIHQEVRLKTSNGTQDRFPLGGQTVASFYEQLMEKLDYLGIAVKIHPLPNELPNPIPFYKNTKKLVYQPASAQKLWRSLVAIDKVFNEFKAKYTGKSSPVHFFWGSFDLAHTRFSGKRAPTFEGEVPNIPKDVMQESYSHEVFSVGFWPGNEGFPTPLFYAYCYPNYPKFKNGKIKPKEAFWTDDLGEFVLPYEVVQKSANPKETLHDFLQSSYEAGANAGKWDRENLDCDFSHFDKKNQSK